MFATLFASLFVQGILLGLAALVSNIANEIRQEKENMNL